MKKYTIKNFEKQFPTDDVCLEFLFKARYPKGATCPKCQKVTPHYRIANRKVYSCQFCGTQVSPTANTIFHKSNTPLRSWFHAIFLMASTKTGISAKQLERELGVTYKTAWRIFKEVRKLMTEDINPLTGKVEVDETYVGGATQGEGRGRHHKTLVGGIVEIRPRKKAPGPDPNLPSGQRPQHRGGHGRSFVAGRLRLGVLPNRTQETLEPLR